jgi:hypothetical protein
MQANISLGESSVLLAILVHQSPNPKVASDDSQQIKKTTKCLRKLADL